MKILVVLGNRMNDDGSFSDAMMDRLNKTLVVADDFDKIVVTGGVANPMAGVAEADMMSEWLVENGIPMGKLVVENRSHTTKENAKYSAPIIKGLGAEEVTLLSSAKHIDRKVLNPVRLFKKYTKLSTIQAIRA
ncbi:MAG: YdcF family protein [Clostridia bacterium]|nr:YdcF family protein [Clostridia bacterium]